MRINVRMSHRCVYKIGARSLATEEELKLQWFLHYRQQNFSYNNKAQYKNWLLLKGFDDIHTADKNPTKPPGLYHI